MRVGLFLLHVKFEETDMLLMNVCKNYVLEVFFENAMSVHVYDLVPQANVTAYESETSAKKIGSKYSKAPKIFLTWHSICQGHNQNFSINKAEFEGNTACHRRSGPREILTNM